MKKILKRGWQLNFFFAGAIALPLSSPKGWNLLSYKKIPSHRIEFGSQGLIVNIESSAAPIIYKLHEPKKVVGLELNGRMSGSIDFKGKLQGEKGADDFALRAGLVVKGAKRLNFLQKAIAPPWVLKLHSLAPPEAGIDHIEFFNLVSDKRLLNQSRQHPLSDLIQENFVWLQEGEGDFSLTTQLKSSIDAVAVWLAMDGDDTHSKFKVVLKSLILKLE